MEDYTLFKNKLSVDDKQIFDKLQIRMSLSKQFEDEQPIDLQT